MSFRDNASFGKRQEYSIIAELLKRGFDIYVTLVDDKGIDCVIRIDDKRYIDIQIKARSKDAKKWNYFASMWFEPRNNYFFIFYTEKNNIFWIIPSLELKSLCTIRERKRQMDLYLPKVENGEEAKEYDKYKNDNGFALLK